MQQCDICGSTVNVVIDIDHISNKDRGYLCGDCSIVVKLSQADLDYLVEVIKYIKKFDVENNQLWAKRFWSTDNNF